MASPVWVVVLTLVSISEQFRIEGCGYFTRDIPEEDFPILNNYAAEDVLLKALYIKAGRKRIREVDTIIPAALAMDLKKWL